MAHLLQKANSGVNLDLPRPEALRLFAPAGYRYQIVIIQCCVLTHLCSSLVLTKGAIWINNGIQYLISWLTHITLWIITTKLGAYLSRAIVKTS